MALTIESAYYGYYNEKAHDVTATIQAMIGNPPKDINFNVSPAALSLQGLSNKVRGLTINYNYGTKSPTLTKSVKDGSVMHISVAPLQITFQRVTYGTDAVFADITELFQKSMLLHADNMIFKVGSGDFLAKYTRIDIAPYVPKVLCMQYTWNGEPQENVVAYDGETVNMKVGPDY